MSHSNTTFTEQESKWITECAGRLRLIQSDAVEVAPESRREFLQEEVERSLKGVPPTERKRYLSGLLERFPVAGETPKPAPVAPVAPMAAPAPETIDETLDRFLGAVAKVPEEKRAELSKRLSDAGLVWVDRGALVLEISNDLRKALGLQNNEQPRLSRLVELTIFLIDVFSRLDQTALTTIRELSPKKPLVKRAGDFRNAAARFLVDEKGEQLQEEMQAVSKLLGALMAAILGGGKEFGRQFIERLSPVAIDDIVSAEGGWSKFTAGTSKQELCWKKYNDLASDFASADLIDRRIKDCLATFVEKKVLGGR